MSLGFIGYTSAAVAYFVLAVLLLTSWRGRLLGGLLVVAVLMNLAWASMLAFDAKTIVTEYSSHFVIESLRYGLWFLFLFKILDMIKLGQSIGTLSRWMPIITFAGIGAFVAYNFYLQYVGFSDYSPGIIYQRVVGSLIMSILGMILVEQLFRNTRTENRWSVKYLFFGLGSLFVYDFFLFADAMLFKEVDVDFWQARGIINVLIVPMLAVAAARNRQWSLDIFVSRRIVFHTAAVLGAGAYLLIMAAVGYYIRAFGGSWGGAAQIIFIFMSFFVLAALLLSDILRAKFKAFFRKNFFRYQYDYREEWLDLTDRLSEGASGPSVRKVVIRSIADLVDSSGGMLWLHEEAVGYICASQVNIEESGHVFKHDDPLVKYLIETNRIIEIRDCLDHPEQYDQLEIPQWLLDLKKPWIIIPMPHQEKLLGFLVLNLPRAKRRVNWEDRDLLSTACKQAASYLALLSATEELKQGDQFAAFNRLSSYVVHDLKNLVAQLGLVVKNAEKFKHNPDFVEDAFSTVKNATAKMERLLMQLRKARFEKQKAEILSIKDVLMEAVNEFEHYKPEPELDLRFDDMHIAAGKDRFTSVIGHLIRNAQEATNDDGFVRISVELGEENASIRIQDNGSGMDMNFIRTKLFAPFETTKGNAGMGVGVYESREFIRSIGGCLEVESVPAEGTTFTISIPIYQGVVNK